ncbi:12363_t:CDS:2, partial [Acaulospora morrowiae]
DNDQMSDVEMAASAISSLSDIKPNHSQLNRTNSKSNSMSISSLIDAESASPESGRSIQAGPSMERYQHPEHHEPYPDEMRGDDNSAHHQIQGQPGVEYHYPNDYGIRKHLKRPSNGTSQVQTNSSKIPQKEPKVITKRNPNKRRPSNANDYQKMHHHSDSNYSHVTSGSSKLNDLRELGEEKKPNYLAPISQ